MMKAPGYFDSQRVAEQLRYTGVMETATIRRQGYAVRLTFESFIRQYRILAFTYTEQIDITPTACAAVLGAAYVRHASCYVLLYCVF